MIELNVEFQEEYKKLDSLCKDLFSSHEGVSEYIRQMESTPIRDQRLVSSWDSDYKQLTHSRRMRNQLAHEVGTLDSDMCTEDDIYWLKSFQNNILKTNDPLAFVARAKREISSVSTQNRGQIRANSNKLQAESNQNISLWKKFILKIKRLFRSNS